MDCCLVNEALAEGRRHDGDSEDDHQPDAAEVIDSELPPDEVVALRFDELAIADELAAWCGGEVALRSDIEEPNEDRTVILVPTAKGPQPASFGDWIVRRSEGDFYPCSPDKFALLHDPLR